MKPPKEVVIMKKKLLFVPLLVTSMLMGCSKIKSLLSLLTEQNYDTDPTTSVVDDGTTNDFDDDHVKDAEIPIPSSFDPDKINVSTISDEGNYYLQGEFESISITAS